MTMTQSAGVASAMGCGSWTVAIARRGGTPLVLEAAYTGVGVRKVINASGSANVSVPNIGREGSTCCDVLSLTEPWRDELLLYRDRDLEYVGPLISVSGGPGGGQLQSQDLFTWMEQRFLLDFHGDGDVADVFHAIFTQAYQLDPSPNIDISTRHSGIDTIQDFKEKDFHRAADALRELARAGLDFTMDSRRLLAGGQEIFLANTPLMLHDDGVQSVEIIREGQNLATDVGIRGAVVLSGGEPVTGRATGAIDIYGLIQRSFAELLVRDRISADANARARLESMLPAPLRVKATLSERAPFAFSDLVPGRRIDVRLSASSACIEVDQVMRLIGVNVDVSVSDSGKTEAITLDLVPLGVSDA